MPGPPCPPSSAEPTEEAAEGNCNDQSFPGHTTTSRLVYDEARLTLMTEASSRAGAVGAAGRRMTLLPLVGALYFMVSGGPYGLEELAQKVGFGGAVAILLAVPVVWSLPTALMVGELAAALPEEGGYYAWVRRALGPFWGFQEAWLSLAASVFDMAMYPTLFVLYLGRLWPAVAAHPMLAGALFVAVGSLYNLGGARAVGEGSAAMTVLLLAPFV